MQLRYQRTTDPRLIKPLVTHPSVAKWMFEDQAAVASYEPVISDQVWYVGAVDGRTLVALFVFEPRSSTKYLVHLAIAPSQWARGVEAFKGVINWAWENIGMERIGGEIPMDAKHALRLAKKTGFEVVGTDKQAFRRNGVLQDVLIVGMSRGNTCQLAQ